MKNHIAIFTWLFLITPLALADCSLNQTLFSCLTKKGKKIEVCNLGSTIRYSFGKLKAKPEIVVTIPMSQVSATSCYACGRYISSTVDIPNGNTIYSVYWGADKLDTDAPSSGGVSISINNEDKGSISCASAPVTNNTEGIKFKDPAL